MTRTVRVLGVVRVVLLAVALLMAVDWLVSGSGEPYQCLGFEETCRAGLRAWEAQHQPLFGPSAMIAAHAMVWAGIIGVTIALEWLNGAVPGERRHR